MRRVVINAKGDALDVVEMSVSPPQFVGVVVDGESVRPAEPCVDDDSP